ncbi:MAG TPA: hypothetical protein DDY98_01890, partial [Ruminococcaceae bacterium]|nr:hypothetical protein [Oscillospiraceae bacterium]
MKKIVIILLAIVLIIGGILLVNNIQSKDISVSEPTAAAQLNSVTVTMSVRCDTVKQHAGKNPAIPADGIILDTSTEAMAPGSTAYDLLVLTAKKNGFTFVNQAGDGKDAYITSIHGIDAGEYGDCSGWLLYVN